MKTHYNIFAISIIICISLFSCGSSDKQQIERLLSKRESAIENKNGNQYIECIDEEYKVNKGGKLIKFNDIKKSFEYNSKIFDTIELTSSDINIYLKDDNKKADVYQKTQYRLVIEKDQSRHTLVEEIGLEKIGGKWKITKESDVDLFKVFAFGS